MREIKNFKNIIKIQHFIRIFEIFEPLLAHLVLPDLEYGLQKIQLEKFNDYSNKELTLKQILKFQEFFKNLLLNSITQDALKVHDLIREAFLNKIAIKSPNCLTECHDFHGCCHGFYSVELMDYNRIIFEKLLPQENFDYKYKKYRLKLKKLNNETFCSAFDFKTKYCLIHKYKPPTCSKYPLITNVFTWNKEQKQWIGKCAHGGNWTTYVSPIFLHGFSKLWIKTILLWEREQEFLSKFKSKLNNNKLAIGKIILAIKNNKIYNRQMVINLLSEDYTKNDILELLNLIRI
ncbi:MAG: hypothetical protein ACFFCM_13140 [Promethearchaeota archaeon]